jgi:hypothetical protein
MLQRLNQTGPMEQGKQSKGNEKKKKTAWG